MIFSLLRLVVTCRLWKKKIRFTYYRGARFTLNSLPRLLRQEPALAAGRERQELWESIVFDIRPDWK